MCKEPMPRLKVLFITSWYPTPEMPVVGTFVKEHARAAALHSDITILHLAGPKPDLRSAYQIKEVSEEEFPTWRVWHWAHRSLSKTGYFPHLWSAWAAFREMRTNGFQPDIIHAHIYLAGVPAVLLGRFYNLPVVITEHYSAFPSRILSRADVLKARFAFRRAKLVLPVSKFLRDAIQTYDIKAKFRIIPNVVDTSLFSASRKNDRKPPRKLLTVALLGSDIKGIRYLLQGIAILSRNRDDFQMNIIGDGPKRQEYERLTARLNIKDKVVFHGLKSKSEVAEFMRQADVFVLPSLQENCPCAIIEAIASGLPIVATKVGGIPEIVPPFAGVLIPPKNAQALANALNRVINQRAEGRHFDSKTISDYAKENFSYEAVGKQLHELYLELVNQRTKR